MTIFQILKTITKIVTILPVVIEGIKAIIARYKALNDADQGE